MCVWVCVGPDPDQAQTDRKCSESVQSNSRTAACGLLSHEIEPGFIRSTFSVIGRNLHLTGMLRQQHVINHPFGTISQDSPGYDEYCKRAHYLLMAAIHL